ncbi:MAG: hypothetical protein HY544_01690 [Candidatus Diapherotrites archaeon]|uniref:50S ribosomal protein L34e n=1 Tax=Candidatus Iainarchaeum sp. TaxID=3101447 RepID=A0A8T3YKI4_9ARCH|nr:hypothetical protein [Candidatus Diapherotrites archaeon]
MVDRQTRVKLKKFRRTPGGRKSVHYSRSNKSCAECAVTGKKLHGMPGQGKSTVRKRAKSERRPSVKFGGILSSPARKELWESYALIQMGKIGHTDVPVKTRKFLSQLGTGKGVQVLR